MDRTQKQHRVARAMRVVAHRLIAGKGDPYPFGAGRCIDRGQPCCAFGEVLREASGNTGAFETAFLGLTFVSNNTALARLLGVDDLPEHVTNALVPISDANDHENYTERQKRSEVADRLFYAADVLTYAHIPAESAA